MQFILRSPAPGLLVACAVLSTTGLSQQPIRVSVNSAGEGANSWSFSPAVSADGRYVVFASDATNLVAGDTNDATDVFVRDVVAGLTTRVSVATGGAQGDWVSGIPYPFPYDLRRVVSISADGTRVAFVSSASNFAPGAVIGLPQVYVHDRTNGTTTLASRTPGGSACSAGALEPVLSGDGRFLFFTSGSPDLAPDGNPVRSDLYVFDIGTGTVTRVYAPPTDGHSAWAYWCSTSTDGRHIAFMTETITDTPSGPHYWVDVVLLDRDADADGIYDEPGAGTRALVLAADTQYGFETPDISAGGRFVVYQELDGDVVHHDRDADGDGLLDEAGATATRTVAHNEAEGFSWPYQLSISADGRWVASFDRVAGRFTLDNEQLFLRDVQRGASHLVSRTAAGAPANAHTRTGTIALTPDASFVAFDSTATNLVPGDSGIESDVFLAARPTGTTPGDALRYCTSTVNSSGRPARIGFGGTSSVSTDDLVLKAFDCPIPSTGAFFYGRVAASVPFANGFRCIAPGAHGLFRLPQSPSDSWGYPTFPFPLASAPTGGAITAGSAWCFQYWFRDVAGGGAGANLTEGLRLVFGP
jgi:Tol biopolymer transport system component